MIIQNIISNHISVFPTLFMVLNGDRIWYRAFFNHNAGAIRWTPVCDQEKETIYIRTYPGNPF